MRVSDFLVFTTTAMAYSITLAREVLLSQSYGKLFLQSYFDHGRWIARFVFFVMNTRWAKDEQTNRLQLNRINEKKGNSETGNFATQIQGYIQE